MKNTDYTLAFQFSNALNIVIAVNFIIKVVGECFLYVLWWKLKWCASDVSMLLNKTKKWKIVMIKYGKNVYLSSALGIKYNRKALNLIFHYSGIKKIFWNEKKKKHCLFVESQWIVQNFYQNFSCFQMYTKIDESKLSSNTFEFPSYFTTVMMKIHRLK